MKAMIRLRVDAVLTVYDGFTGRAVTPTSVLVTLDGVYYNPERRTGGYLVFCGLSSGEHEVVLKSPYFVDEKITLTVSSDERFERVINLKPGARYPFTRQVTRLYAQFTEKGASLSGKRMYIASPGAAEIKIAQDSADAGEYQTKLYIRGNLNSMALPGEYMILDGENSEVCTLTEVLNGNGSVAAAFKSAHKRGTVLKPCQAYVTNEDGKVTAYYRTSVEIDVFCEDSRKLSAYALEEGDNNLTIDI